MLEPNICRDLVGLVTVMIMMIFRTIYKSHLCSSIVYCHIDLLMFIHDCYLGKKDYCFYRLFDCPAISILFRYLLLPGFSIRIGRIVVARCLSFYITICHSRYQEVHPVIVHLWRNVGPRRL